MVRSIFTESGDSAGARSVAQIATTRDFPLSRYRANRIMKLLGLVSCQIPKHAYKRGGNEHAAIPNHLDRQFVVTEPNQAWCGDRQDCFTGNTGRTAGSHYRRQSRMP